MLSESIAKLVQYGITTGLTPECERNYTTNLLLDVFHEDDYEKPDNIEEPVNLEATLGKLLDEAVKRGLIEDSIVYRDPRASSSSSSSAAARSQTSRWS